jgi:HEAT repeat protein
MSRIITSLLALALMATPLLAHGGQYKGPSDAGNAGSQQGGTVAPPTNPGGAAAPGPGAATSGAASTGGARTSTGRVARGGSGRKGATTSAGADVNDKGFEIWEFWWENNKDRYLNLKDRLVKTSNVSGSPGLLTGRGKKRNTASSRRPTRNLIDNEVIPALQSLLKSSDDMNILDSAVLALGRTTDSVLADEVLEASIPLISHTQLSVQSSTALALGVLGSPAAVPTLQDILQDSSAGRRLAGGGNIHWLVRAFSALSLGLLKDDAGIDALMDITSRLPDTDRDIKICSIVGMGLVGADHPRAGDINAFLVEQLQNKRLDPLIKSFIPTSLGKLGRHESTPALLAAFTDRDEDNLVIQSSAIGLGQVATPQDTDVVETLTDYVKEGRDVQTRHYSLISLAQIGARDEAADPASEFHAELRDMLFKEIAGKGKQKAQRSWGALAGAIYSMPHPDMQPQFVDRIIVAYEDESDPSFKSAFAIALGLLNATSAGDVIYEDFSSMKEQDFRGYAGVALGFLQYDEAAEALRGLCKNKATVPTLRLQAATGLGLMSDTQAVDTLITTLEGAQTLGVSSAVAKALGLIGDQDSIEPLKAIASDESAKKLTRAFACVALGIVGEKTDLPWNAAISANNNYRAKTESIEEVLDIL